MRLTKKKTLKDKALDAAGALGIGAGAIVVIGLLVVAFATLAALIGGALLYVALILLHNVWDQAPLLTYWQSCAVAFFMMAVRQLLFSGGNMTITTK